jgi:hnRNP-L/PTB/hephaestus splicing factor
MWNLGRKKMAEHQAQPNLVPDSLQSNPNEPQWYSSTDPKRRKVDQQVAKSNIDPHNAPTSRVVHGRAIPDGCTFQMILNVLQRFGKITYITMMPRMRQTLVEFERKEDAVNCVNTTSNNQLYILERPVFFNYSTSQEITRSPYGYAPDTNQLPPDEPAGENHVLLYTILNPIAHINVEVLHTISSPYGVVQRIAIFRKNGVQALVEFDSNTSAARAKTNLEGADIYAGCCTLKTEYARTQRVNVYKNDDMTWDFTIQGGALHCAC